MDEKRFNRAKAAREHVAFAALGQLFGIVDAEWMPPYMRAIIVERKTEYTALTAEMDAALGAQQPEQPSADARVKGIEAEQAALRG